VSAEASDAADQLRSLHEWLADVEELRGTARLKEGPPEPGTLGPVVDALVVALGPAGAVSAFATAVIAWLRTRRSEVRIKVTLANRRSMELTAKNVSELDAAAVQRQVLQIATMLSPEKDSSKRP
jgi:hypothetical protein